VDGILYLSEVVGWGCVLWGVVVRRGGGGRMKERETDGKVC